MKAVGVLDPSAGTVQMSAFRLPVFRSVVVRVNKTVRSSGDSAGSLKRTAVIRSLMVIGRLFCAEITTGTNRNVKVVMMPARDISPPEANRNMGEHSSL